MKLNTKMKIVHEYIHIREVFQALIRSRRASRPMSVQTEELFQCRLLELVSEKKANELPLIIARE